MSVALNERVDYADSLDPCDRAPHQRRDVIAAVVATLAVIAGPLIAAGLGAAGRFAPVEEESVLTPTAQRVLEELPGAYASRGLVVVPAATDPGVAWNGVPAEAVEGEVVNLEVRGLAEYGYLPSAGSAPAWLSKVSPRDRVFSDVGDLYFACTLWAGADACAGSLLMEHEGELFLFRAGLRLLGSPDEVRTFRVLDGGLPTDLALGRTPVGATGATVTLEDGQQMRASVSAPDAVGGATVWWVSTTEPVAAVKFVDGDRVLDKVVLGE